MSATASGVSARQSVGGGRNKSPHYNQKPAFRAGFFRHIPAALIGRGATEVPGSIATGSGAGTRQAVRPPRIQVLERLHRQIDAIRSRP
jgi:hypothetical protein